MTANGSAVLVVDDDIDVRHFVRASLEAEGFGVIEAPDGDTALRLFSEFDPAAILLDLGIGQPDGLEVCRRLRQKSNVPILMHTSHSDEIDEAMCMAAGADDYLTKPVSGRLLVLHLAAQLKRVSATPVQTVVHRPLNEDGYSYSPARVPMEKPASRKFLLLTLIGTLILGVLGYVGLLLSNSHVPQITSQALVASGAQSMTATELIQSVNSKNGTMYWLGAKLGDSYTSSNVASGVDQVSYYPNGSNISKLNSFEVEIGTYQDISTYNALPHPFLGDNGRTFTLNNGSTLTYNQLSPDSALVAFADRPEIIVVNYPIPQTLPKLISDSQNLVQIA